MNRLTTNEQARGTWMELHCRRMHAIINKLGIETCVFNEIDDTHLLSRDRASVSERDRLYAAMYSSGMSLPTIAELCGNDHSTVLASLRRTGTPTRPWAMRSKGRESSTKRCGQTVRSLTVKASRVP